MAMTLLRKPVIILAGAAPVTLFCSLIYLTPVMEKCIMYQRIWSALDIIVNNFLDFYLCLETFFRISGVSDSTNEPVAIDHRVWPLDDISIALFFPVLVVGVLVIVHIETELVLGIRLKKNLNTFIRVIELRVLSCRYENLCIRDK